MAQVSSLMLARFMRLPRRSADAWQGGILRMPMWVDGADGTPYRPWGGVWVSLETGLANVKLAEVDAGHPTLAVDALLELAFKFAQTRPAAIQVADRALGEQIACKSRSHHMRIFPAVSQLRPTDGRGFFVTRLNFSS